MQTSRQSIVTKLQQGKSGSMKKSEIEQKRFPENPNL